MGTPPGLALRALKAIYPENSIMDTPVAPWCGAHVPSDMNDSIVISEPHNAPLEKAREDLLGPHIPAVPYLRRSHLRQLRLCSQRRRHLAHHPAAPQVPRNSVSSCTRVARRTLSCVEVCTSDTRAEMQGHQALPPDADANISYNAGISTCEKGEQWQEPDVTGTDIVKNDSEENSTKGHPTSMPLSLAWHQMSLSEDLADAYKLPADIYEAITKGMRIKTTLCEAI